jgi:Ca2+-binding RTX toxin-like protein
MATYNGNSASNYHNHVGSDTLKAYGNDGNDKLWGHTNNDTLYGGNGNDYVYGEAGNDYVYGDAGNDRLYGDAGNDSLYGGTGNDSLYGGTGNDYLYGGDGVDRLDGYATTGTQYDYLSGGSSTDYFVLSGSWGVSYQGSGHATITDWNHQDWLEVKGSSGSRSYNGVQYSFSQDNWGGTAAKDTGLYYGEDLICVLQDTTAANFNDVRWV